MGGGGEWPTPLSAARMENMVSPTLKLLYAQAIVSQTIIPTSSNYTYQQDSKYLRGVGIGSQYGGIPVGNPVGTEGTPVGNEGTPVGNEGTPVGNEGTPVGNEGTPVGNEGTPVGKPVGTPVGIPVGNLNVGTPVGGTDGNPVGKPVGMPVGIPVGNPVGIPVGKPVGRLKVGTPVGGGDGTPVGRLKPVGTPKVGNEAVPAIGREKDIRTW